MLGKDIFLSLQHIEDVSRWNKQTLQNRQVFGCGSWYLMVFLPTLNLWHNCIYLAYNLLHVQYHQMCCQHLILIFEEKIRDKECNDSCKRKY